MFCARNKHGPRISGPEKEGWWAADGYVYLYYDTRLFTGSRVPKAKGFDGSSQIHALYGLSDARQTAQTDGPLRVRNEFDACDACMQLNLSACKMARELGTFKLVHARTG